MSKKRIKITPYQLKKHGFKKEETYFTISLGDHKKLVYKPENMSLSLLNVYLNHLRKVKYIDQIEAVYKGITDHSLPTTTQ